MLLLKEEWDIDFLGGKFVSDVAEPPHISSFSVMFSLAENCKQSETAFFRVKVIIPLNF